MSRSTKSKGPLAKDGKMYWKVTTLRTMLRGGVRVQSGCAAVCVCMSLSRRDECSGAPQWPVGCGILTGQGASEYAGAMQDELAVGVLAEAVDSTRGECGCLLSCYRPPMVNINT